jgi:phage-related protein
MDELKSLIWVGASKKELKAFPRTVQRDFGQALFAAQAGGVDPAAKPMKGFKGVRVMEITASYRTDAYRVIYTVNIGEYIFVLHAFQKKSKTGIKTPQKHITMINQRLLQAKEIWQEMNQ